MATNAHPANERYRPLHWVERALNLDPGDLRHGMLLLLYLFLVLACYTTGKVARDAMFLARFAAVKLPYADIASAVLVGIVVAGYVRLGRRTSLCNLLVGSTVLFGINGLLFWVLAHWYRFEWLYPVFYVWVGIYGVLAPAQVWTLANFVLTTREARRLFGMIASGAIAGNIFAGFFTKRMVKAFGTDSLLLAITVFMLLAAVLVYAIWRQAGNRTQEATRSIGEDEPRNLRESMSLVWSSGYLRALAAVIWLCSTVSMVVNWQFKAIANQFITKQDALAVFFADFTFYTGILCLAVQLLLTSRLLRRFGMGPALFVVPLALLGGEVGVLILGTLVGAVLLRGADQVLRYSVDKSTVELLFLPLPARIKFQVKWFIDTVIWRLGDGMAGVTVLVFATYLQITARHLSWGVAALIACWIAAAYIAKRKYGDVLATNIRQHRLELEHSSAAVLDRDTTQVLGQKLAAEEESDVLYALNVFEIERHRTPHPAIRGLLAHPSAAVRQKALSILAAANDAAILPQVEKMLADPDLQVRTEALLFLCRHEQIDPLERLEKLGDFADFSIRVAMGAYFVHPGPCQNLVAARKVIETMVSDPDPRTRLEAARLLSRSPDVFDPLLSCLVADSNPDVVCEAVRAVAALHKRRLVPDIVDRLAQHELCETATEALAAFGESIVGTLRDHLADESVPLAVRRQIPEVLAAISSPEAVHVLEPELMVSDTILRHRALAALTRLVRRHRGLEVNKDMMETVLAAEILGHYRSHQILHMLAAEADDNVRRALAESMEGERERIFRLLSLIHPEQDFDSAYYGLQSTNPLVHDNALEFLEHVLKPEMRQLLVPLLDARISVEERASRAANLIHVQMDTPDEAVAALVGSDDPWLRSCGAYAIGRFGLRSLEPQLDRCLNDPDPLLRQAAREAKQRLALVP